MSIYCNNLQLLISKWFRLNSGVLLGYGACNILLSKKWKDLICCQWLSWFPSNKHVRPIAENALYHLSIPLYTLLRHNRVKVMGRYNMNFGSICLNFENFRPLLFKNQLHFEHLKTGMDSYLNDD
jgi:hypothetical protein